MSTPDPVAPRPSLALRALPHALGFIRRMALAAVLVTLLFGPAAHLSYGPDEVVRPGLEARTWELR